jgi:hypothetical protein
LSPSIERRPPTAAVALLAAACATVLAAGGAVAVARAGTTGPAAAASPAPRPATKAAPRATKARAKAKPKRPAGVAGWLVPLDDALPAYERIPDKVAGAGAVDVTKAAVIDSGDETPSAKDKALMRDIGFVRGHSRVWDDGDSTVVVYVYEWRTSAGARAYVQGAGAVHERTHDAWDPSTPNATGSCRAKEGDVIDSEVLHVGRHTFIMAVIRDGTCRTHALILKVAKLQYDHARALPA